MEATVDHENLRATIAVPLSAQSGAGTFRLQLFYSFCKDGPQGVCYFANGNWQIPVAISAEAEAEAVSIDVVAEAAE